MYFVIACCAPTQQKKESCVTQDKTVYRAKAKFILTRIEQFEINTVYCVELFLNQTKIIKLKITMVGFSTTKHSMFDS